MEGYLTLKEAAEAFGMTPRELVTSRQRGLEPGKSGRIVSGELVWPADLEIPAGSGESSDRPEYTLAELRAEAKSRGLSGYSKLSKAELEELLDAE